MPDCTVCQVWSISLSTRSGLLHFTVCQIWSVSLSTSQIHCLPDLADSELHVDNEIDTDLEYNSSDLTKKMCFLLGGAIQLCGAQWLQSAIPVSQSYWPGMN